MQLPLFYGATKHKLEVIEMDQEQNRLYQTHTRRELFLNYIRLHNEKANLQDAYSLYKDRLLEEMMIMERQAFSLLESGEISLIDYLQSKQSALDIELDFLEIVHQLNKNKNSLDWYNLNK
jgi:cobalt-zinc-cadmium resistance protein CzcA